MFLLYNIYVCFYIPLSIGIGMALILLKHDLYNGITATILLMLLVAYNVYKATTLKGLLIKFEPKFILDTSLKGLIVIYSIFAVTILMLGKTGDNLAEINVGEKIAEVAKKPIEDIQKATGLQELQSIQNTAGISGIDMAGIQNIEGLQGLAFLNSFNTDATVVVEKQINSMLLPYKSFFKPIMAIFILFGSNDKCRKIKF